MGVTPQAGSGGELRCLQLTHLGLQPIDAAAQEGEFTLELFHQPLELIGNLTDAIQTGVQQGGGLVATDRLTAPEGAIRIAGDAAVTLDQIGQRLIGPVAGLHIGELLDAGDLIQPTQRGIC